jgi:hypothetical protein
MLMKDKTHFAEAVGNIGVSYLNSLKEFTQKGELNQFAREYYALGGGRGVSKINAGTDFTRRARADLTGRKGAARALKYNPWEVVGFVSDMIESGPRCAMYMTLRSHGTDPQTAFKEAMEATVDFQRGGTVAKELNRFFPFFNAGVQGADRFMRYLTAEDYAGAGKEERVKVVKSRLISYVAASLLLSAIPYALNHATKKRKEEYQAVSNYVKNTNWLIPVGNGKFIAIGKSREVNVLSSLFERLMDRFVDGNKHALDDFYGYAIDQFFPGVVSDFLKLPENIAKSGAGQGIKDTGADMLGSMGLIGVISSAAANRNFLGNPIVSQQYQNLNDRDQYNGSTSKLAYWIGQAFNISPMMLDYVGKNVLGYIWKYPAQILPVDPSKADWTLGIKNTFVKDAAYSTDVINRLYDYSEKATKNAKGLAAAEQRARDAYSVATGEDRAKRETAVKEAEAAHWQAQAEAKMADRLTSIYSTFNRLNRADGSDTARDDRYVALQWLGEQTDLLESGKPSEAQKFVLDTCARNQDTKYLPSALPDHFKVNGKDEYLTATEYWLYQMRYLELYYQEIERGRKSAKTDSAMADLCTRAQNNAKAQSQREILAKRRK